MLIELLIRQPGAMVQIVQQTPYWVWGLLAGLLGLGASQMFARSAGLLRVLATPVAMAVLSAYGVISAFGPAGEGTRAAAVWLAAALVTAGMALWLQPHAAPGTRYAADTRSFHLPGSAMPLALILGIFLTKYLVGVELVMQPALARDTTFALQIATLYGVFNGLFAARSARLLRMVWRSAALPSSGVIA